MKKRRKIQRLSSGEWFTQVDVDRMKKPKARRWLLRWRANKDLAMAGGDVRMVRPTYRDREKA